ncbi:hypothetical protein SAMN02949497_3599 [Methylomagnum ishizawai]|uniref:Uncharacterized protein n=1 Tax=Methylomagnum ishizawai TaxID=1760988 RepID=A0A1Y6CZU8_9GAMM|nr:hypothetical protein SAMN02949497_3599 [Methylomagnum ishizawai]
MEDSHDHPTPPAQSTFPAHRPDRRALMLAQSLMGKDSPAAMGFGYRS